MWIFTTAGFASIVQHPDAPDLLVCRTRVAADLDEIRKFVPAMSQTIATPSRDYPYRSRVARDALAQGMARLVLEIGYVNFKSKIAVQSLARARLYESVWQVMFNAEQKLACEAPVATIEDGGSVPPVAGRRPRGRTTKRTRR